MKEKCYVLCYDDGDGESKYDLDMKSHSMMIYHDHDPISNSCSSDIGIFC